MVLAVTSSIVKNTAATIADRIAPMLPTWLTNDCAIARSDDVLVSAGEFANITSICLLIACARFTSLILMTYQPIRPLACCFASSK